MVLCEKSNSSWILYLNGSIGCISILFPSKNSGLIREGGAWFLEIDIEESDWLFERGGRIEMGHLAVIMDQRGQRHLGIGNPDGSHV